MSLNGGSGAQVQLNNTMIFQTFDQTQTSLNLPTTNVTTVKTLAISNTEANFDYLVVVADGWLIVSHSIGTPQVNLWVCNDTIAVGSDIQIQGHGPGGALAQYVGFSMTRVLTAGTDYVKGTGFNLTVRAQANEAGSTTVKVNLMSVSGVI